MSKRAEEAALKAYPDKEMNGVTLLFHEQRRFFQEGYEQAERDLPKWKKSDGALRFAILEDEHGRYIQHDGYKLYFDDLLKLPKEGEQ